MSTIRLRSWALAGLFAGAFAGLALWVLLGAADSGPTPVGDGPPAREAGKASRRIFQDPEAEAGAPSKGLLGRIRSERRALRKGGSLGPTRTIGFLATSEGLERALGVIRDDLDACHRTSRFHEPATPDTVELTVSLDGSVQVVDVGLGKSGALLEGCIATVMAPLKFDGPPTVLTQVLTLSSE